MLDTNRQHSKTSDPADASCFSWLACCSPRSRNRAARGAPTPSQPPRGVCSGCFSSLGVVAVLHAELYALLQQKPPPQDSHPERQPPVSHAPASPVQPAHAEPEQRGQAAQSDGTVMHVRSHQRYTGLLSPRFNARPEPCDETELGERQHGDHGEWSVLRPVRRRASAPGGERLCGTCLVAIGSDATIFMAHDRPFCSAACQMCTAARAYSARLVHASLPCPPFDPRALAALLRLYTSLHVVTSTSTFPLPLSRPHLHPNPIADPQTGTYPRPYTPPPSIDTPKAPSLYPHPTLTLPSPYPHPTLTLPSP
jgi:hypothetical protein